MLTLVVLPGMDGVGQLLERFLGALGSRMAVCVLSYPCDQPLGYRELLTLAEAALPAGPLVLLGESFSGPIAISLAAKLGADRVKALVLCCSFAHSPRGFLRMLRPLVPFLPMDLMPPRQVGRMLLGRFATPALCCAFAQSLTQLSSDTIRRRLACIFDADVTEQLRRLQVPILYLRARHDRLVPRAAAESIARVCPQTQIVDIEAPHFLLQLAPIQAAEAVVCFLAPLQSQHASDALLQSA